MSYSAEIISVGTELLLGNIANTDAKDVSEMLSEIGINVYYHTVVGDNPDRLLGALKVSKTRADIIITTGGLGPTCDDLTKQTVCKYFARKLIRDEATVNRIIERHKSYSQHASRPLTENNFLQADLPENCTVFQNDHGSAPGCAFTDGDTHVLMLPGPPRECVPMFKNYAVPYLMKLSDGEIHSHNVHVFGLGESAMEARLHDKMLAMTNPTMAPYARTSEAFIRVTAKAENREKAETMMEPVIEDILSTLGDVVYGVDTDTLENTVIKLMAEKKVTLSTAESCTGGLISKRLTDISGSSSSFMGGVVSYSNEAKVNILGVNAEDIAKFGAVSDTVAIQMAEGVRSLLKTDIGIGTTGIAGPNSDGSGKPVGLTYIALATKDGTFLKMLPGRRGDRDAIRQSVSSNALDMLRRYLTGKEVVPQ